jgi:hypothetical protein
MRLLTLWDMYQIYAHNLLALFDELRDLEVQVSKSHPFRPAPELVADVSERLCKHLVTVAHLCLSLDLTSSQKQIKHILNVPPENLLDSNSVSQMIQDLRRRIREDLEDHVYFCVPEVTAARFFIRRSDGLYFTKVPSELMDPTIVARFPAASEDIEGACRCFAFDCFTACVFHLMRVVEIGVLKIARLSVLPDPRPSWGAILKHVEKLVLRTKYEDLDPAVQPHRNLLESLLPQMQAIQRAWRNKFTHVEDKVLPEGEINPAIANELMVAVEAFMRTLAMNLPPEKA